MRKTMENKENMEQICTIGKSMENMGKEYKRMSTMQDLPIP